MSGALTVNGSLRANSSLYVGTDDGKNNDFIYFDSGTSQHLRWDNSKDKFHLTNDLSIANTLQAGVNSSDLPTLYNRFGIGVASHPEISFRSDLFVSGDLEVDGGIYADSSLWVATDIYTGNNLWVGSNDGKDNDFIYFDSAAAESLQWNDSAAEFQLSDDLKVNGEYRYASAKTYNYEIHVCEFSHSDNGGSYCFKTNYAYPCGIGGNFVVYAPVHIPTGATVTGVTFYYRDNNSHGSLEIHGKMYRTFPMINYSLPRPLAEFILTTTDTYNIVNVQSGVATIDDSSKMTVSDAYQYYIKVFFEHAGSSNTNITFNGCRITYTMNKVAP